MSSKNAKKSTVTETWGTPESYFKVPLHVSPLSEEDLEWARQLTPSQRVEWLLMMQKLLIQQFYLPAESAQKKK